MKKYVKKIGVLLLALAMVLSTLAVTPVQAKTKAKYVTRAEVLSQVEKLIGATVQSEDIREVKDVKKKDSYYKTMSIALNAGLVEPNAKTQKLYPQKKATWNYVAGVLANILETDKATVLGAKKAGAKLTQAQLTAFLNKKFPNVIQTSTATVKKGNVVINKPGVTLKNVTITGKLIIGDGVADEEVTLKNVTVKGKTIIRGGGINSVILKGSTNLSTVIIRQVNNAVSLKVQGDAQVSMVYINDGSNDVNIVGSVGELNVQGSNLTVNLVSASVKDLTVAKKAANATIILDEKSFVDNMTLNAAGTTITGDGKAATVYVNANQTTVAVDTDKINVKKGVETPATGDSDSPDTPEQPDTPDQPGTTGGDSTTPDGNTGGNASTGEGSTGGGSGASGGSSSGGSTGGSTTGGSSTGGTTDDESSSPVGTLDEAFADGYPKVEMSKDEASVTVTYKLKEQVATPQTPAAIYSVISTYNTSIETDVEAVLHGHLGMNDNPVWANYSDYLQVTDSEEHSVTYTAEELNTDLHQGLVVYSVVEQDNETSTNPVKVQFDAETTDSYIDNQAPWLMAAYRNQNGDKIYLYFSEALDASSVPATDCFTLSGDATVTAVTVASYDENNEMFGHYVELTLNGTVGENETVSYQKPETGSVLQDQANIPNEVESTSQQVERISTEIEKVYYSADGTYLFAEIPCRPLGINIAGTDGSALQIKIDGMTYGLDAQNVSCTSTMNGMTIAMKNLSLSGGAHTLELTVEEGIELKNYAFDSFETVSTTNFVLADENGISSAVYDSASNVLAVTLMSDLPGYQSHLCGCYFMLMVNGKEYQLRGFGVLTEKNPTIVQFSAQCLKHIDFSGAADIQIKYVMPDNGNVSETMQSLAGKPVQSTQYINVTINN